MPELPEVETIRAQLAPRLEGRTLASVEILDPRLTRPVDLFDHVAEQSPFGLTFESVRNMQGDVRHAVRDVQEERLLLVFLNEVD